MRRFWKRLAIGLGLMLVVALLGASAFVATLVFPSTPKPRPELKFVGYIDLPKQSQGGVLSILDYLTIEGRQLYITSESSGVVYRAPLSSGALPSGQEIQVLSGAPAAHGVAFDPVSGFGFVSHSDSNTVDVFDPKTLKTLKRIPAPDDVDGIFYEPSAKLIYAVSGDLHEAILIDPATQTATGAIDLGGKPEFASYDPKTQRLYQNLEDVSAVAEVDLGKRAVVSKWPLTGCVGPTSITLDQAHRLAFIVCSTNAKFVGVDLSSHRTVAALPVGGGPDSIAYDPSLRRLYVAGKAGVLTVIQQDSPDAYRVVDSVKLHYGAHTLAYDGAAGRLYVAYASLLIPPRLAVFQAQR